MPRVSGVSDLTKAVGHALRLQRENRGLTIGDVFRSTNISRPYITQIETGERGFELVILDTLARAVGTKASTLVRRAERAIGAHSEVTQ